MRVINIAPVQNTTAGLRGTNMYMFLTHLVEKYPEYVSRAKAYDGHKILDNSLIELGGAVDIWRVLEAAEKIRAHEIILPDVFQNYPDTAQAVRDSIEKLKDKGLIGKYKLMGVCQGAGLKDFERCFKFLCNTPEIDVIGIPKVCAKMHPIGRPYFEYLWSHGCPKKIHLLGLWYSWEELDRYIYPDMIRSCDTCHLAYQLYYNIPLESVRPDGFTIDLEQCTINDSEFTILRGEQVWKH